MNTPFPPQNEIFWHLQNPHTSSLNHSIQTDVVVLGGGMAGLSTAQGFREKGMEVVLLEKNLCGSGATGRSSGFITPSSELSLDNLAHFYGHEEAKKLWNFVLSGGSLIRENIRKFNLECDYQEEDTLVLATSRHGFRNAIQREYYTHKQLGYESKLYDAHQIQNIIGSAGYYGGIAYGDSFGIDASSYCTGMKNVLQNLGVAIYENTPAIEIKDHVVVTAHAQVKAKYIIVCVDRFLPSLGKLTHDIFQAQTFLMMSYPLLDEHVKMLFPEKKYMAWDTHLIYNYFRLTGDNRLMLGGSNIFNTYVSQESHNPTIIVKKLQNYFSHKFPELPVAFEYVWPGLIGLSKDLLPIAGRDKDMNSVYYVSAATGLPWAAALGAYSAQDIVEGESSFEPYFSPYRKYTIRSTFQSILGKPITFALSNMLRMRDIG